MRFTTLLRGDPLMALAVVVLAVVAPVLFPATARAAVDYSLLDAVLVSHVRNGYVDYDGIATDSRFGEIVGQFAAPGDGAATTREEQLAFLINAYNVFAIKGVIDGKSPAGGSSRSRFLRGTRFRLAGRDVTLEEIERGRLAPFREPRVHFAIVGASLAAPRLQSAAYRPDRLDNQLDLATRRFVNDITRNLLDVGQRAAFVSTLFRSFEAEFIAAEGSVPRFMARYADDGAVRAALNEGRLKIRYLPDDEELNGSWSTP